MSARIFNTVHVNVNAPLVMSVDSVKQDGVKKT